MSGPVLEVRTNDETLRRALTLWWRDFSKGCCGGYRVITDLDTAPALGIAGEITISRHDPAAALLRPFSFEELESLILAAPANMPRLIFAENEAILDGEPLCLTPLEKRLLRVLWESSAPKSTEELSRALFGEVRASNQINVYISYLRKKTDRPGKERLIVTERNKGFTIRHD